MPWYQRNRIRLFEEVVEEDHLGPYTCTCSIRFESQLWTGYSDAMLLVFLFCLGFVLGFWWWQLLLSFFLFFLLLLP